MALNARTRRWLDAAPAQDVLALGQELATLADHVSELRRRGDENEARHAQELEELRSELRTISDRVNEQAQRVFASVDDVDAIARALQTREEDVASLSVQLTGLASQMRWEVDDLRKALIAVVERTERGRSSAGAA